MSVYYRITGLGLMALAVAALAMTGSAFADPSLGTGLMASWSFDEGAGMVGADSVAGYDANLLAAPGTPAWTTGHIGSGALAFDGVDDGAPIFDSENLNSGVDALTVATWVKLDTLPSDLSISWAGIIDANDDNYVLYLDKGSGELRFKIVDSNGSNTKPGIPQSMLDTTNWHQVVAVYDGAGYAKLYCDGVLADVHTHSGLVDPVRAGQTAGFGYQPVDPDVSTSVAQNFFPGSIDETAIWSRVLTPAEIGHLYNGGAGLDVSANSSTVIPNPMPSPVIRYEFENNLENWGTGGATYDGAMVDGADGAHSYATVNPGNHALEFECAQKGDGDHVQTKYTMADEGTISFWCRPDEFFNWLALMDNSVNNAEWEMWVYGSGVARFRISSTAYVSSPDLNTLGGPGEWQHFAVSWDRMGDNVVLRMFVNGDCVGADTGTWADPGEYFYLPTGQAANDCGDVAFDDFRIYEQALTPEQIEEVFESYPIPEPSAVMLLISALAFCGLRRKSIA